MTRFYAANNWETRINMVGGLGGGVGDTTLTVVSAAGCPTVPFKITIEDEICNVTAVATNDFTIARAQEGTSRVAHADEKRVENLPTAEVHNDLWAEVAGHIAHVASTNDVHGLREDKVIVGNGSLGAGTNVVSAGKDASAAGNSSVAVGRDASSANSNSVAVGYLANASHETTTAIGSQASALADYAVALGAGALADGAAATAVGRNADAGGLYATALGLAANAAGSEATALGVSCNASGAQSLAAGRYAAATNTDATALGRNAAASGISATAVGHVPTASGQHAVAVGYNPTASGTGAVAIGTCGATATHATAVGYNSGATHANSTALGNGAAATADNTVRIGNSSVTSIGGQVAWTTLSDKRDKRDIQDCLYGLGFINKLKPMKYIVDPRERYVDREIETYTILDEHGQEIEKARIKETKHKRDGSRADKEYTYGFVAQDVIKAQEGTDLHIANETDPDKLGITMENIVPILVKAVQELSAEVQDLRDQLARNV